MKNKLISVFLWSLMALVFSGCKIQPKPEEDVQLMVDWNHQALETEIFTDGIAVPIAARFYGFYGFIPVLADAYFQQDLMFFKKNFPNLALPEIEQKKIDRSIVMNIAYFEFASRYYINLHYKNKESAQQLFEKWDGQTSKNKDKEVVQDSKILGLQLARALLQWSSEDSIAHQANLHNFDRNYVPPKEEGKWEIDSEHPMPALLPTWGKVKPVLLDIDQFKCKPPYAYSRDRSSPYYLDALELFTISSPLSYESKWIAEFWSDDVRGLTFTPAGRWISILNQLVVELESSFDKAKEAYFKLGIGLCDSGILAWKNKYIYNVERPASYIRKNIQDAWRPFHESPNFPAYPSGHSVFGGVASEIFTGIFGDNIEFTDKSHEGRKEFLGEPRSFHSIREMAIENAYSRIVLGVHFRMDCTEGLRLGSEMGKYLLQLDIGGGKSVSKN